MGKGQASQPDRRASARPRSDARLHTTLAGGGLYQHETLRYAKTVGIEGATLAEMFEQGRSAWPSIVVERARFDTFVAERAGDDGGASSLRAEELYLVCACAEGEPTALAEFDRSYFERVPAYLAHLRPTPGFVDDVRQQLRHRLFVEGKVRQYRGRGKLASWLRVVTVRVALNMLDAERSHDEVAEDLPGAALDPELLVVQRRYGETFRQALRDALGALDADDRSLLRLHFIDGLNIGRIALVFQVSRATIGRRVIDVRERILAEAWRLLQERVQATPEELESLLRAVRSDLEVSLSVILRDA